MFNQRRQSILEIIKNNNTIDLKKYLQLNNVILKDLNTNNFDVLINAIENNASVETIDYLLKICQYETLNYSIIENNNVKKSPLFSAIGYNNFKVANFLLERKADINFMNNQIIEYLYNINLLNKQNLKYILNNGFNVRDNINSNMICKLIDSLQTDIIKIIFKHIIYDNNFILSLLKCYKNKCPLSDQHLNLIFRKEKNKIKIDENMYKKAKGTDNYEILNLLFNCDGSDENVIKKRIDKYELLEIAVKNNIYHLADYILKYITFSFKSFNFETVLSEALKNNNIELLKLIIDSLLKNSKNEKYKNQYLNYILNMMIKANTFSMVKYFINCDDFKEYFDINMKDINGDYPIIVAFYNDDISIFQYLLNKGANCNVKNNNGVSLLFLAIHKKKYNIIQCLLQQNININEKDINGNYSFIKAIKLNDIECVKLLVKYGIDNDINMNVVDINGSTPLILAYRLNYQEIFRFLIKFLDFNKIDSHGNCLLYYSVLKKDVETTKYLIRIGADVNFKDKLGNSILNTVIYNKNMDILFALIRNNNVFLNVSNKRGETPLISIIRINDYNENEKKSIVDCLIERGADVNSIDNDGNTPLVYAIKNNLLSIVILLVNNGASINHQLKNENNKNLLMLAIESHANEIIKFLVDNNADINFRDESGDTPLVYLLKSNNNEMANYLIDNGADVYSVNNEGESIYTISVKYNQYGYHFNNQYINIKERIRKIVNG
ncbi:ankyrin [Anaeromyces robustus]|uniref:Ankyrin n=1 Tax=Anaeromyces robustus TaxID=1754192 RepID=A0A1Y1X2F9_9FUNG|nr:ankyrin [Anaeromyces robustus]|eukprot:ORX79989.1 ankyrin [Anaeromyces robustus]